MAPRARAKDLEWYKNQFEKQKVKEQQLKKKCEAETKERNKYKYKYYKALRDADEREVANTIAYHDEIDRWTEAYDNQKIELNEWRTKCTRVHQENEKLKVAKIKKRDQADLIRTSEDGRKAKKMIAEERRQKEFYQKKMLEAQADLRIRQEQVANEVKPWRCCEICGAEYTDEEDNSPRILTCGHTMCFSCVLQSFNGNNIRCPFDRTYTIADKQQIKKLPKNFTLLHM